MAKRPLQVVRSTMSLDEIARALRVSSADALEKFMDPRVCSWFAEIWGETLFGYRRHLSSNNPGSDAQMILGAIGRFEISVRCFNRGNIKFQKSKFIGSGRKATPDDLIESVESVERIVIVDLRKFPVLSFYPIDSKDVLRRIRQKTLTTSGLTPKRFDEWLAAEFETHVTDIIIPIPDPPETAS
jgi:hypothetical protein